jgi:hypothetical protein
MTQERPMMFSMASLVVAAPSGFDRHAMQNLRIAIERFSMELKPKSQI